MTHCAIDPFLALVAAKEAHQIGARIYSATTTEYIREMNQLEKEMDEWSPFDDVEEGRAASKRLELERSGFAPDRNYDGQAL